MVQKLDRVRKFLSYDVINCEVVKYKVYLTINKNGEEITFVFCNTASFNNIIADIEKQNHFKVLNENNNISILKTLKEKNSNWLLTDNNFNLINCANDYNYNPICKESQKEFEMKIEFWGCGRSVSDSKLSFIDSGEVCDYETAQSEMCNQKVYLLDLDIFVYVPKTLCKVKVPSQTMYLFYKTVKDDLHLHLISNKSDIY